MKIQRNSKGFTLIELLIVIAIVGILAAIAIPQYMGYTRKTKVSEVVHSMGAVKNALIAYYTEKGVGPTALADSSAVSSILGVTPATRYVTSFATNDCSTGIGTGSPCTITATFNGTIYSGFNGSTITLGTENFSQFTWGGNMEAQYIPKN